MSVETFEVSGQQISLNISPIIETVRACIINSVAPIISNASSANEVNKRLRDILFHTPEYTEIKTENDILKKRLVEVSIELTNLKREIEALSSEAEEEIKLEVNDNLVQPHKQMQISEVMNTLEQTDSSETDTDSNSNEEYPTFSNPQSKQVRVDFSEEGFTTHEQVEEEAEQSDEEAEQSDEEAQQSDEEAEQSEEEAEQSEEEEAEEVEEEQSDEEAEQSEEEEEEQSEEEEEEVEEEEEEEKEEEEQSEEVEEEQSEEEEEEEEVEEVMLRGNYYYCSKTTIYEKLDDDDVGDEVGYFKKGIPVWHADEASDTEVMM